MSLTGNEHSVLQFIKLGDVLKICDGMIFSFYQGLQYRSVPMGTHGSSPKNWGWAVTQRRCLNSPAIPVQAPTPDLKLADRRY